MNEDIVLAYTEHFTYTYFNSTRVQRLNQIHKYVLLRNKNSTLIYKRLSLRHSCACFVFLIAKLILYSDEKQRIKLKGNKSTAKSYIHND